jgi:gamma-glutamylcyclotransferase (GGCT)/AIG2-like uncharacterized protein YtfP
MGGLSEAGAIDQGSFSVANECASSGLEGSSDGIASTTTSPSSSVFVYGTLKPGERNFKVAERGGRFTVKPGYITGFDLLHFEPENYPGILPGNGVVHGFALTYEDIDFALSVMDVLEGINDTPPLYTRVLTRMQPGDDLCWVYVYANEERCRQPSARLMPDGVWTPQSPEDNLYP